jgi:hexosaminidase
MAMIQKNLSKASADLPSAADNYAGSYTIADLQELINYANLRQITIIPEIDIPGHSRALMKAMPEAFYEAGDNSEYAGYGDDVLPVCAFASTSELGQRFTADLTTIAFQITKIFNQQTTAYAIANELSIGGDEVFSGTWEKSPSCQVAPWKSMNTRQKEHYFLDLFNNNADLNHIKLSGWHEFVINRDNKTKSTHGVSAGEVGHVWVWSSGGTARKQAVMLANEGYPVVMDYADSLYFDMTYTPAFKEPGFYWATKFGDTYAALDSADQATLTISNTSQPQNILGLEGALWADVIPDYTQLQYMALPKLAGLAEAAWSTPATARGTPPNWRSLAHRLGCGQSGFLSYLHQTFNVTYRGYPNGISREAPLACQ